MPAKSKKQQKLMGMALAYKRGELDEDEVSDKVKKIANSMSEDELEDYAETERKGLPSKVESLTEMIEELLEADNFGTVKSTPGMGDVSTPSGGNGVSKFADQQKGSGDPPTGRYGSRRRPNRRKSRKDFGSFDQFLRDQGGSFRDSG